MVDTAIGSSADVREHHPLAQKNKIVGGWAPFVFIGLLIAGLAYMYFSITGDLANARAVPWVLLILALICALGFEFVNGFHDTANAVATVIYTNSMPAEVAVIWSGIFNFLGVITASGAVAFGIISLLPVELIMQVGSSAGLAMVFALLIAAILWNVGTWYLGLPASSSHTLIGSIIGVGIANQLMAPGEQATSGGQAGHCPWRVEWLSKGGQVLAASDYQERSKFLTFACEHRAPRVASHWEYLLQPMVPHHSDKKGVMRYRQLEYYRMPFMAYLAFDRPHELTRADHVRLGLATEPGNSDQLPFSEQYLARFEHDHCYDRHHGVRTDRSWAETRFMSCGHALVVTGDGSNTFFTDAEHGALGMFRHQHFLLFLIAHFHKAALLMFSDRLAGAVGRLEVGNPQAMLAFRSATRQAHATFLRFTHRYWFHEVSNHEQSRDLFELCRRHLGLDRLYQDVRQEIQDMSEYLENEAMRRQNESMMRLTVVTTFGLIGTVATGFLGMNLFSHSDQPPEMKLLIFMAIFLPVITLTLYTVKKSRRLSEFLEALSDDTLAPGGKWRAFWNIWLAPKRT